MPTILRIGAYRFFFYANEGQESAHIHVQANNKLAKFWLQPVNLASSIGFDAKELNQLLGLVVGWVLEPTRDTIGIFNAWG